MKLIKALLKSIFTTIFLVNYIIDNNGGSGTDSGSADVNIEINSDNDSDSNDNENSDSDNDNNDDSLKLSRKELEKEKLNSYEAGKKKSLKNYAQKLGLENLDLETIQELMEKSKELDEIQNSTRSKSDIEFDRLNKKLSKTNDDFEKAQQNNKLLLNFVYQNAIKEEIFKECKRQSIDTDIAEFISNDSRVVNSIYIDKEEFLNNLKKGISKVPINDKITDDSIKISSVISLYLKNNEKFVNKIKSSGSGTMNSSNRNPNKRLTGVDRMRASFK